MMKTTVPTRKRASSRDTQHTFATHSSSTDTATQTMADPRDFLTLCRLGAPGLCLLVLGLAGVIVQKNELRRSLSFAVLVIGAMLLFDAATRFHRLSPEPIRSLTFLTIALTPLLFTIVRSQAANVRANRQTNDRIDRTDR